MPLPEDLNKHLSGKFNNKVIDSLCKDPAVFCMFCCCGPCAVYAQRRDLLDTTREPYVCCGGAWPLCGFETPLPPEYLIAESCCIPGAALAGNRFLMQTRMNKQNTKMDKVLSFFHCCVDVECMVARLCFECSVERENLLKSLVCVCPTSHCQVAAELQEMKQAGFQYTGTNAGLMAELPVHFSKIGVAPPQMKMTDSQTTAV